MNQSTDSHPSTLLSGHVKELDQKIANIGRPTVFVASSIESKLITQKVKDSFPPEKFQVDLWHDGIFGPTRGSGGSLSNMEWLKNFTDIYDFAIFIFAPDDHAESNTRFDMDGRAREAEATRHNVIFEFGMFLGRIGVKRSFILFDEETTPFVNLFFTDLKENLDDRNLHIEINKDFCIELYPYKGNYKAYQKNPAECLPFDKESLSIALSRIQAQMIKNFAEIEMGFLPATTLAFGYYNNFVRPFLTNTAILLTDDSFPAVWLNHKIRTNVLNRYRKELQVANHIRLKIVVPNSIEGARQQNFTPDFDKSSFIEEQFPGFNRSITVKRLKDRKRHLEEWVVYDVPTTLNSSIEAIELLTAHHDIRELLKEKELRNFRKAMEYKLALGAQTLTPIDHKVTVSLISYDEFRQEIHTDI